MDKAVVQAPCQQLLWQLGYLKRSVLFHLPPVVQVIDLHNEVLNFSQKEGVWEQPGPDTINLLCQVQSYLFQMLCLCSILCMG
jgi:hypothetical protein